MNNQDRFDCELALLKILQISDKHKTCPVGMILNVMAHATIQAVAAEDRRRKAIERETEILAGFRRLPT